MINSHYSVLLNESINYLNINPKGIYIDATFGRGGHSRAIINNLTTGRLIAFDKDIEAVNYAKKYFKFKNFNIFHCNFINIYNYCLKNNLLGKINGIIIDLGVSSPQLDNPIRGFSFMKDGPLDMRMDTSQGITASKALKQLSIDHLIYIFKTYGNERFAKRIAFSIKNYINKNGNIKTTLELAKLIYIAIKKKRDRKNPATRCFQALRIYVNNELDNLKILLGNILKIIKTNGRIAIISFHSLEDRLVKQKFTLLINQDKESNKIKIFKKNISDVKLKWIAKKIKPNNNEVSQNIRSRSAILRVVEKI